MKSFRTPIEREARGSVARIFDASRVPTEAKLEAFPCYAGRVPLKRFLALYEIFKRVIGIKGSVIECGVFNGFGLMSWAKLSAILEPENLTRRVYGFDSFRGFPSVGARDVSPIANHAEGDLRASSKDELRELLAAFDRDRFLGHIEKVHLIEGDATETIPRFVEENQHLVVSLLFLDFDLYEPTRVALERFLPRMPRGAIVAFDELDNPQWPGETAALLAAVPGMRLRLERVPWDPYIAFAEIE